MVLEISHATETATYLGYTIELAEHDLTIFAPDGEELVENARITLSGARRFIRKHRAVARSHQED